MRQERGFTLVELLVVFAILGLLMGLAPVAFDRLRDAAQYRDTVRTMLSQMRSARYHSVSEAREIRFTVDLNRRVYWVGNDQPTAIPASLTVRATVADIEMAKGTEASIRFLPGGGATGGNVEVVRASGAGTRLRVDWLSGRVMQEALP